MIKKDELYFNGTTSGETLKPFLFHVVMMFVLPVMAFFFSRDMLSSRGYSDKDQNIYAGFISIVFVLLVIVSYVLRIIADEDNWTPQNQKSTVTEGNNKVQSQTQTQVQEIKTAQNAKKKKPAQEKNLKKVEESIQVVNTSKSNKESNTNTVTQRNTTNINATDKQRKEVPTAPVSSKKNNTSSNSKKAAVAPKKGKGKEEIKEQPKPQQPKRKIKSNNPFDYIV